MNRQISITLFVNDQCPACAKARTQALTLLQQYTHLDCKILPVMEHLDDAVQYGITRTPAWVVNGQLHWTGIPTARQLRAILNA